MTKNECICDCPTIHKDVVDEMKQQKLENDKLLKSAGFFKILGDATRIQMLYILDKKEMCVCDIANVMSMSKSSISHQLSMLKKHGVVKNRREGKEVYYSLDDEHVSKVIKMTIEHIEHINGGQL